MRYNSKLEVAGFGKWVKYEDYEDLLKAADQLHLKYDRTKHKT